MIKKTILTILFALSFIFTASPAFASTKHAVPEEVQYKTYGPGISYPDSTDPTRLLPRIDQIAFQCIRSHESRNHLVDGDGSEGWYQFTISIWDSAAEVLGLPATPNEATGDQQSAAAVWYFERNGRFGVEWAAEAGECPGKF